MRYVLDASVALKWRLREADSDKARRLRDDFRSGTHDLIAPDFFPLEVAHALTRAERTGTIPVGDAAVFILDVLATPPHLFPTATVLLTRAIAISSAERHGFYDCLYIALAEREGCEFVTADDKLVAKLRAQYPRIKPLSELP